MKKALFAHQSTIPHYRVPFYNSLKKNKPEWWDFEVIDIKSKDEHEEAVYFKIKESKEYSVKFFGQKIKYQSFLSEINGYDLLIIEDAVNNLSYPLSHIIKSSNTKIAYWGHGKDVTINDSTSFLKKAVEKYKLRQVKKADGYFAYMPSVKDYLIKNGVSSDRIFTVYNTIDIEKERKFFKKFDKTSKDKKRDLLFVGRLTASKNINFLLDVFGILNTINEEYNFTIVGDGDKKYRELIIERSKKFKINFLGEITDKAKLAEIFSNNSMYVFPGFVGLGPLHAMCYDLIPVIKESKHHKPEIEYLNHENSVILPENSTPQDIAEEIENLVKNYSLFWEKKKNVWPSIKSFTIENMANNFIEGVNELLQEK